MPLIRKEASELIGSRAYFTEWSRLGADLEAHEETQHRLTLRKLKGLLLTKRSIIFAASDLASPVAFRLLSAHPELLDEGILMPALRAERTSIEDVTKDSSARAFLADRSITAVSWSLDETVDWFKDRLIAELETSSSVIRTRMLDVYPAFDHSALVIALSTDALSVQQVIDQHAGFLPEQAKQLLLSYRALLYHMSGARIVHSESFLPQENLDDCDVAGQNNRTRLSEDEIFFKIFVEQALSTLGRKQLPIEILDSLTIPEILALRSIYETSDFIERYEKLTGALLHAALSRDSRTAICHLEELATARDFLFENYTRYFEKELSLLAKSKRTNAATTIVSPATSVALGISGFVLGPAGACVASLMSLAKDTLSMRKAYASMINLFRLFESSSDIDAAKAKNAARLHLLKKNTGEISSSKTLLEAAEKYSSLAAESFRL